MIDTHSSHFVFIGYILSEVISGGRILPRYNLHNRNEIRMRKRCCARSSWRRCLDANGRGNVRRRDVSVRCEPPSVQRRPAVTECVPNVCSVSSGNNALSHCVPPRNN